MDFAYFGMTRRPFRPTPDTTAYFPAASHEAALIALRDSFASQDGLALIDGEAGSGKTLVALRFLESESNCPCIFIPVPRFSRSIDLFQAILHDLGVDHEGKSEHELRLNLSDHLLSQLTEGTHSIVVIDEAQHLSDEILEEIRLLGNLESRTTKAVFITLVAQPSLRDRFTQRNAEAFARRIDVRCRVDRMTDEESTEFIRHQIRKAGGKPEDLITTEALEILTPACRGLPRLLNQAAYYSFSLARSAEERSVDVEAAHEALVRLGMLEEMPAAEDAPRSKSVIRPIGKNPTREGKAVRTKLPKRKSA